MERRRDLGWLSSVGFGGTCGLSSRGGSSVRDEIRKHGEGGGRRGGSGGYHERGHLGFLREDGGQREGRRRRGWGLGLLRNEVSVPVEQEEE